MDFALAHEAVLTATPPFSFAASLRAMSAFRPCSGDHVVLVDRVRKALPAPGAGDRAVVVEVAPHSGSAVRLLVYAQRPLPGSGAAAVETAVRRWLGLDDDLRPFLAMAAADPPVAALLDEVTGLHQVRFSSLAEGTAYFALSQRSTQWFAAARKRRIAADLGPSATLDGMTYPAFPPFTRLTGLGVDGMLPFAGNAQRAGRLAEVVDGVAALDEEWLRTAPYAEARAALLGIRGVGGFTAHAILLRVLGRPDEAPLEMAQFTAAAEAVYGPAAVPGPAELRARYGAYIGWWAYFCRTALGQRTGRAAAREPALSGQTSAVR